MSLMKMKRKRRNHKKVRQKLEEKDSRIKRKKKVQRRVLTKKMERLKRLQL